jgi:nanoRNase/pAp phosphatase (c-di-AMP/oligoRNAs hydrolase)
MLAMTLGLRAFGKDASMPDRDCAAARRVRVPRARQPVAHAARPRRPRLLAVDCANERRIGEAETGVDGAKLVVNVDHHHDNDRFGISR